MAYIWVAGDSGFIVQFFHNFYAKTFWQRGFFQVSKEVLLWFHFWVGPIAIWKQNPEFPRADLLPFMTTAIHSQPRKHVFLKIMLGWNKEVNSFCRIECVSIFEDGVKAYSQHQYFRELLPLWNWEGLWSSWYGFMTWDRHPLLAEGSNRTSWFIARWTGFLQVTGRIWYSQYLFLIGKGREKSWIIKVKSVFPSKSKNVPDAWAIGDEISNTCLFLTHSLDTEVVR